MRFHFSVAPLPAASSATRTASSSLGRAEFAHYPEASSAAAPWPRARAVLRARHVGLAAGMRRAGTGRWLPPPPEAGRGASERLGVHACPGARAVAMRWHCAQRQRGANEGRGATATPGLAPSVASAARGDDAACSVRITPGHAWRPTRDAAHSLSCPSSNQHLALLSPPSDLSPPPPSSHRRRQPRPRAPRLRLASLWRWRGQRDQRILAPPTSPSNKSKRNGGNSVWTCPASRKGKKKARQPGGHGPGGGAHPGPSAGGDESCQVIPATRLAAERSVDAVTQAVLLSRFFKSERIKVSDDVRFRYSGSLVCGCVHKNHE
ncbi:protein TRAUCO [Panicum miliaceum]|uniref:Protein TRAUCO n=1 Tax=Panicum miliaceum TaxID=4540 RepID=A0A3L6QLI1_PANMI|nr:protein TRAUCO [Panicum miliaceum]